METDLGELEESKENVLPLRRGRKIATLQAASDENTRDHLTQKKQQFETELRLYTGEDELDIWYQYILWVEQNFPKGGQDGNLPVLLERCLKRFRTSVEYKDDERYVDCWLKFLRYSPSTMEVFLLMDAQEIGKKSASFYESWSWHLEQLGNFRKANAVLQEGIDNNAQPLRKLLDAQKQLSRKFVQQYNSLDQREEVSDGRSVLGGLKPVGKKHRAPVSRVGNAKLETAGFAARHPVLPSTQNRIQVLQDSENIPPVKPTSLLSTVPSDTWDTENHSKRKPWNNVKHKTSEKFTAAQPKPEFKVHEDDQEKMGTGRKLTASFTTVLRGSRVETRFGFIEPDDPHKLYICDFQKLYGGAVEFQPEEIAALRWQQDQKKKREEEQVTRLKEELHKLKSMTATSNACQRSQPNDENVKPPSDLSTQETATVEARSFASSGKSSPRSEVSSPTRDVIALWNATLSIPDKNEVSNELPSHSAEKLPPKPELKKPAFLIHMDEREENVPNHVPTVNGQKSEERTRDVDDDFKENQAPVGFARRIPDKASPHNVLQITDRPINFGEQEDEFDQEDDDLGVRPFSDEEFHTTGPLTSQLHFIENLKISSTPCIFKKNVVASDNLNPEQSSKLIVAEFKTPLNTEKIQLSPIIEASREISKYTTSSSSGCSSAQSIQYFTSSTKSILCPTISMASPLDPFDPELVKHLLSSANIESRAGCIRMEGDLDKIPRHKNMVFGQHKLSVKSQLVVGGEGVIYHAETKGKSHWPRELVVKVYQPTNLWEFYICSEIQNRIDKVPGLPYVRGSLPAVLLAPVYNTCNLLIMEYCPFGNLLDLVNLYSTQHETFPECLSLYLTWEILHIVHQLHASQIVHADIKPDNFMVLSLPTKGEKLDFLETYCVRLVDFGQSVDLSMFPKGTTFNGSLQTENFVCPEMLENKPWTFHTDYFGILGTIHILLFHEYMEITKVKDKWETMKKFKRYWKIEFWNKLFDALLNVPDCDRLPDLSVFAKELEQILQSVPRSVFVQAAAKHLTISKNNFVNIRK